MVNGRTATAIGDTILIKLTSPYEEVLKILSYSDTVNGEDTFSYFDRHFRWSTNDVTYSDWMPLTDENLQQLELDPTAKFYIQYKYEVISIETGVTLEFVSIALEIITKQGNLVDMPCVEACNGDLCGANPNLIIEDCCPAGMYNPYNLNAAVSNYMQLSCLVAQMFGYDARYYKCDPRTESKDVILKEFSLYNVSSVKDLKINVPDNEFPTRELSFDDEDVGLQDMWEVHIVKSHFESVFGKGSRPGQFDYVWFPKADKLFEVNSIALPDDFNITSSYYRVMLTDYVDRKNRDYENSEEAYEETMQLIEDAGEEFFKEERENEEIKVRKPNLYNTITTGDKDYVRREISRRVFIREEKLRNNYTVIAKYHYKLDSIPVKDVATVYRYTGGISETDNRSFTFWIRHRLTTVYQNVSIDSISASTSGNAIMNTVVEHGYSMGDIVRISGTQDYNGIKRIIDVNTYSFEISTIYNTPVVTAAKSRKQPVCEPLQYGNGIYKMTIGTNFVVVSINDEQFVYDLQGTGKELLSDTWYSIVFNLSNTFNQMSLFIWDIESYTGLTGQNTSTELRNVYQETKPMIGKKTFDGGDDWLLSGAYCDFTNFRIFKQPIEIEEQSLVLNQYVVADTHLCELLDNAIPELRLASVYNPK